MPTQPELDPSARLPRATGRQTGPESRVGRPDPRGRGSARGFGPLSRWGALQGGLGVCLIIAGTAIGAVATMVAGTMPGGLLGIFVIVGTIAAALAVRPSAGRMLLPVPVLSYLVAALVSGVIYNRGAGSSNTALAIGAAQWIANGFFPMALATVAIIVIITIRWVLGRRHRHANPGPGWSVPADGETRRPPRPPVSRDARTDSGYPASRRAPAGPWDSGSTRDSGGNPSWNAPASPGPSDPGLPGYRRPEPRPESGPYNLSGGV